MLNGMQGRDSGLQSGIIGKSNILSDAWIMIRLAMKRGSSPA